MNRFKLAIGRWRLWWGLCPECNSDAPEVDCCPVCRAFDRMHFPPTPAQKLEWWNRYVTPATNTEGFTFGMAPNPEPWLKRSWRFILQAYGKHVESANPATVLICPPRVYAKDAIYANVTITLSLLDKLRLLLGCNLQVKSVIYCETPPGYLKTETTVFATFD